MVHRGGFSFMAMLVINPIVILFYQNCSMVPTSQAARSVASVSEAQSVPVVTVKKQVKLTCNDGKVHCLSSNIE